MDLAFTKEEMAFREEVRQFFKDNVPPDTRRKLVEGRHLSKDEMVTWWRILNKKGWGVSHCPNSMAARAGPRCSTTSSTKSCSPIRRRRRLPSASAWSAR